MPIYEYKCNKCGREFEVFQGIADSAVRSCKFCRGSVRKLMSLSSFHLKGSGWYATDYCGKKAPSGEKKAADKAAPQTNESKPSSPVKSEE